MGLRAGLDWCGKSRPTGIRSPDRPARRQSLYRLSYPAHRSVCYMYKMIGCCDKVKNVDILDTRNSAYAKEYL